jgi:hypothetical protein
VLRVDMQSQIHSAISNLIGVMNKVTQCRGTAEIEGVPIASGGVIAPRNTVIVNSSQRPTKVFGVADGRGFLLRDVELNEALRESMRKVEVAVVTRSL